MVILRKITRHCINPLISMLNISHHGKGEYIYPFAYNHYRGKEMFHSGSSKIFARLTHADRNKEFMHFTIVHKFLVFYSVLSLNLLFSRKYSDIEIEI